MKMLRVKLKNLNNLRRVSTELYVAPTSWEKNWEAVLKSQFYTAQYKLLALYNLQRKGKTTKNLTISKIWMFQ